jgi:hypothetical protein
VSGLNGFTLPSDHESSLPGLSSPLSKLNTTTKGREEVKKKGREGCSLLPLLALPTLSRAQAGKVIRLSCLTELSRQAGKPDLQVFLFCWGNSCFLLVPRLCLGAHCPAGSACRADGAGERDGREAGLREKYMPRQVFFWQFLLADIEPNTDNSRKLFPSSKTQLRVA